jgi:hypothetical protein
MIDFNEMISGGNMSNITTQLSGMKKMIPQFAGIMQTYLQEGESEIIALGTFEPDKEGVISPFVRLAAIKKESLFDSTGKEVNKMNICRIVKNDENEPMQWNLLEFLNMLPNAESED